MAIEMTNTSICFYSAYMTKPTLFGDEPHKVPMLWVSVLPRNKDYP